MSDSRRQLLIVGCAHDEFLVHAKLRDIFADKVHIPLPSARERRRLMRTAWEEHQQDVGGSPMAYPASQLDAVADSSAGLTVIPLLCAFREAVRAKALPSAMQSISLASDAARVVSSGGGAQPFTQVAGLEHVKRVLQETVLWPRQYAHLYRAFTARLDPNGDQSMSLESSESAGTVGLCAGILLFGPPGMCLCRIVFFSLCAHKIRSSYCFFPCSKAPGKLFFPAPCRKSWDAAW